MSQKKVWLAIMKAFIYQILNFFSIDLRIKPSGVKLQRINLKKLPERKYKLATAPKN